MEKSEVKPQPERSPARVTGSVSRGSTCDVDVTDGTFRHLWGEEATICGQAVMRGLSFECLVRFSMLTKAGQGHSSDKVLPAGIIWSCSRGTVLVPSVA